MDKNDCILGVLMHLHKPVLRDEAVNALHVKNQAWYIDGTLGAGGHTIEILKRGGNVLGIDADQQMLEVACQHIEEACPSSDSGRGIFIPVHGNFKDIKEIVKERDITNVQGVLLDLGISTMHYTDTQRGFSFAKREEPLDMRLDIQKQSVTAADLLNVLREDQLHALFEVAMDYRDARFFSKTVVRGREKRRMSTVGDLLDILPLKRMNKTHPATKVFMALRMAVNTELENIELGISGALEVLASEGVLAIITFHSTEEKLVKHILLEHKSRIVILDPVVPSPDEISENPSSRSAKLRVAKKI
jgi:16S rRNA (cytosine1402-N4)-methyltransferase